MEPTVRTDRTVPNNKLDIIVSDNKQGKYVLIDAAIRGDRNVVKKEAENILTYKDLITEIQRMWNVEAKVMPVIIGATGTISKSLRQYLSHISGKHEIKKLQKNSHIGHCTHTAGSANVKVRNIFHGRNSITCSTNCKYRTAATIYEGHLESKERFAIKKYLLIIGKKKNMQVLSHTFTYFST